MPGAATSRPRAVAWVAGTLLLVSLSVAAWLFGRRAKPEPHAPAQPAQVVPRSEPAGGPAADLTGLPGRASEVVPPAPAPARPEPLASAPASVALASLDGRIVDSKGDGLAGVPLFLIRAAQEPALQTESGLGGDFRFREVPAGAWKLAVGGAESPIVPALPLELAEGPRELEAIALPALGTVRVLVLDDAGRPVPQIEIHGRGDRGGEVHGRTDADGTATANWLPAGAVRVFASDPQLGRGNQVVALEAGATASITISLRRKP